MALDRLTPALAKQLNYQARVTPFTAEEKAELAQRAGVSKRHAENFFAAPDAKVQRDLIPKFAENVPFSKLPPNILARVEVALTLAAPSTLLGTTTHKPFTKKGNLRKFEEPFTGLLPALDRVQAFQDGHESVDVYLRHFWTKLDLLPVGDGTWVLEITYRSGAGSPPLLNPDEYDLEEEEDEDEGGY